MTGRDVEREIDHRIHQLKVSIENLDQSDVDKAEFEAEMLARWHVRRQALQDLKDWYRAEISAENRARGHYDS